MMTATTYPKISSVKPGRDKMLLVTFDNGDQKIYDCMPLLQRKPFNPLQDESVFRCVHADSHGYGVLWNDDIDLAESELWLNGRAAEPEK
jgi:hypothetical protein